MVIRTLVEEFLDLQRIIVRIITITRRIEDIGVVQHKLKVVGKLLSVPILARLELGSDS